jgi:hypothetical protein
MSDLDKNFKRVFSFELLLHRIENTKGENGQYSKILLEKTIAGLVSQGKIEIEYNNDGTDYTLKNINGNEKIAEKLNTAKSIYHALTKKMGEARSDSTMRSWMDGQVLEKCHLIDVVVLPITISEGLQDQSETLSDFANQFAVKPPEDEE